MDNRQVYLKTAKEVCKSIFEVEYYNGLGIPLPEIRFIEPDSINYISGEYFIKIGDTWQIHLNFGLLPVKLSDFSDEVKVITRHEVEHYNTCPFDVLTHLRMLKSVLDVYLSKFQNLRVNIDKLAPQLVNEAADIVIDTHNFRRYPKETLKSEIEWIKKGSIKGFNQLPRHSKLMFLTKQILWDHDLGLDEHDPALLTTIGQLAKDFDEGGITSRDLFLAKIERYAVTFFQLVEQDINDSNGSSEESESSDKLVFNNQSDNEMIPSKDFQQGTGNLIFQSPDKIKNAIEQFAQETDLSEFIQILDFAGLDQLSANEKKKIWFDAQDINEILILKATQNGSQDTHLSPQVWKIGDPIEDLDIMLTYSISPIIIPGVTTKKWSKNSVYKGGIQKSTPDLLIVLDSSSSMGSLKNGDSNLHNAVQSCFGIIKHFERYNAEVALINFSTKSVVTPWTKDYEFIKNGLFLEGGGNTIFPIIELEKLMATKKNKVSIVIITDGEIQNEKIAIEKLKNHLLLGSKVFMFLQDKKNTIKKFMQLEDYGAVVSQAFTAEDIRNSVTEDLL